jgi:isopenicillin-N N-acyltransferase like protein
MKNFYCGRMWRRLCLLLLVAGLLSGNLRGQEAFRYPAGEYGAARLAHIEGIPVLCLEGTPEEIGDQFGRLAVAPCAELFGKVDLFVDSWGLRPVFPLLMQTANVLAGQFPPDHLRELDAAAKSSGQPRELLTLANTFHDLMHIGGCSVLMVEARRSATGAPLMGRNLDAARQSRTILAGRDLSPESKARFRFRHVSGSDRLRIGDERLRPVTGDSGSHSQRRRGSAV